MKNSKCFVITSKGFIKEGKTDVIKDSDGKFIRLKSIIKYTKVLREAKTFTTKQGEAFLNRFKLDGFVYNPFRTEFLKDIFKVGKKNSYHYGESKPLIETYEPQRIYDNTLNDVTYLKNDLTIPSHLTFKQAQKEALKLNKLALKELTEKIKLEKQKNGKIRQ